MSPDGILVVDKPAGWTSSDVVGFVRGRSRVKRVGHAGTLDPAATGVLPLCLGRATRLSEYLSDAGKSYVADIELGVETDTYDAEGSVVARADATGVSLDQVEAALAAFRGEFLQTPPLYSAIKQKGVAAYKLARRGLTAELPPRPVSTSRVEVLSFEPPHLRLAIDCSKGFYVRSLAHDLGQALGVGGMLAGLVRTRVGRFSLDAAVDIETLRGALEDGSWSELLFAADEALLDWQALIVGAENEARLRSGRPALVSETGDPGPTGLCRAYGREGVLLAVLRRQGPGVWRPEKVFAGSGGD